MYLYVMQALNPQVKKYILFLEFIEHIIIMFNNTFNSYVLRLRILKICINLALHHLLANGSYEIRMRVQTIKLRLKHMLL